MQRFSVYEEYGAKYEMMQRNIEAAQSAIATWPDYDRAIETLSATVNPIKSREANRRKAMTVKDLLIKARRALPRKLKETNGCGEANTTHHKIRAPLQRSLPTYSFLR